MQKLTRYDPTISPSDDELMEDPSPGAYLPIRKKKDQANNQPEKEDEPLDLNSFVVDQPLEQPGATLTTIEDNNQLENEDEDEPLDLTSFVVVDSNESNLN